MSSLPDSPSPAVENVELTASIHFGANSTSLLIAERGDSPRVLDFLEQPAPIGRDIFRKGRVTRSTVERCVSIVQAYQETLKEYAGGQEIPTRIVATNILAEASNREAFLSRIEVGCHLEVEMLDDGEMTRLIYLKTQRRLEDIPSMRKRNTLVLHVGPGNTRALLFKKGRIFRYTSYRLGTHRTGEAVIDQNDLENDGSTIQRLTREHTRGQIEQLRFDYRKETIQELVVIGYEIQLLAPNFKQYRDSAMSTKDLLNEVINLASLTLEERARHCGVDFATAPAVLPALSINLAAAEAFNLKRVLIPQSDFERGLLLDLPFSGKVSDTFQQEVIYSAELLAKRYQADPNHYQYVAQLTDSLFQQTQELHQLTEHDRLLLRVATILHETGSFISPRAHHKHSQYIILNSELFGLGETDQQIVALIARYHRQSAPKLSHGVYSDLRSKDRTRVSKMSSLLRIGDALDRSHSQRISSIDVRITNRKLRLIAHGVSDTSIERMALRSKGQLFRDIFGREVTLEATI